MKETGIRETGWVKFLVQDACTQAFRYYDRRQETLSKRDVA